MFDRGLALAIVEQIEGALETIKSRSAQVRSLADLTDTPRDVERLDSLCMLFMAIGEALKSLDKITDGTLLSRYPEIDWKGAMGFRDIIAHHYFDIDAEQVFWLCSHEVAPLSDAMKRIHAELSKVHL